MNFNVRSIGGKYSEMSVDEIQTGTLDELESCDLAIAMINAASELLWNAGDEVSSDACDNAVSLINQ